MLWIVGIAAYIGIGILTSTVYALFDSDLDNEDNGIYFFLTYLWPLVTPIFMPFIVHRYRIRKTLRQQEQDKLLKDEGLL